MKETLCVHLTYAGRTELPGYPGMTAYDDIWAWLSDCMIAEMRLLATRLEEERSRRPQP